MVDFEVLRAPGQTSHAPALAKFCRLHFFGVLAAAGAVACAGCAEGKAFLIACGTDCIAAWRKGCSRTRMSKPSADRFFVSTNP